MPNFRIKKLNNIDIKPVDLGDDAHKTNPEDILGYDYFTEPFSNVFLLAKKNSGKTTVIYHLLENILSEELEQKVYFFVSTIHKDIIYSKN